MAENEMGLTVKKDEDFSEWYTQILNKADLSDIRFGIQGFIVQKPWAYMIIRKIYDYLEKEVEMQGHLPYRFPTVVKEKDLMKEEEHAGFTPEVFWVSEAGDKKIEERAKAQAKKIKHSLKKEVNRLVLHGFLHLIGYDHEKESEAAKMESLETKILNKYDQV